MKSDSLHLKYLAVNPNDLKWGVAVNSVGYQEISAGSDYPPPSEHPTRYLFSARTGRVLSEYQLLYITQGRGVFFCETLGRNKAVNVNAGNMFLLFPGEWHNYYPDRHTGWKEYWIGFNGDFAEMVVDRKFFSKEKPIFDVRLHEDIVNLYHNAISAANAQESGFQQVLGGIVSMLLSLAYFYDRNALFQESETTGKISQAKIMIYDNYTTVSPEEIASKLCLSYSSFRKAFKEYTGFSPARFINEVKMNRAKELLTNTSMSIKEISFKVGYNNHDYFFTAFKHMTGMTPAQYRAVTTGKQL